MRVEITIPKLQLKINSLGNYSRKAAKEVEEQVIESAINIQRGARKTVPVRTGRLRSSIDMSLSLDKLGAVVGSNVHYAKYVEAKKPYLGPAAWKESKNFRKNIARILNPNR